MNSPRGGNGGGGSEPLLKRAGDIRSALANIPKAAKHGWTRRLRIVASRGPRERPGLDQPKPDLR